MSKPNYEESISSRWGDIRSDGPGVYTSILELSDNSIDWGNATKVDYKYDKARGVLTSKDNGPKGFVNVDSFHRFFELGGKNPNVKETTVGKYGKGGYKSIINISRRVEITSYFNDKKYVKENLGCFQSFF